MIKLVKEQKKSQLKYYQMVLYTTKKLLPITQSNQWVGVDDAARIHMLNSPPVTGSVEKIEWLWW